MKSTLDISRHGDVAVVALAHGKANLLDLECCLELESLFATLPDLGPRAVILTGRGRIFSAGVDLKRVLDGGVDYVRRFLPALGSVFRALFESPIPVVAAINGHAIAGGCVLAATADRRILAASRGRIGTPELLVGVPFPVEAIEVMRAMLPSSVLRSSVYGGATLEHDDALRLGLVDDVVEADRLMEAAFAVARELGSVPSRTFALTKRQLRAPALAAMRQAVPEEGAALLQTWCEPATFEALRAYVARTLG